jgi:protein-S-isoprenylcysteine O-methyltransferase Ste14
MSADVVAFAVTGAALLGLNLTLLATLLVPSVQIWPPPGRETWPYWVTWTLFDVSAAGFLVVGGLDAGSLGLQRWMSEAGTIIAGSFLFAAGTATASYAMGYLGHRAALGLEAELVTTGPYALTRNPGYLGDLVMIAGYVILTDSTLAAVLGALGSLWFLLAPHAEEPWLREHYGDAYRRYCAQHPRWGLSIG